MPGGHGFFLRPDQQGGLLPQIAQAAQVKLEDSSLRAERTKGLKDWTGLSQAEAVCCGSPLRGESSREGRGAVLALSAGDVSCGSHHRGR